MSHANKKIPVVIWHFPDGRSIKQPLAEHERQLIRLHHAMAASDDPVLKIEGEHGLREISERLADGAVRKKLAPKIAASAPRPSARSGLRGRITSMMAAERKGGIAFKTLLARWEMEPIRGLALTPGGDRFIVEDDETGETGSYTLGSLNKLFSEAGR